MESVLFMDIAELPLVYLFRKQSHKDPRLVSIEKKLK